MFVPPCWGRGPDDASGVLGGGIASCQIKKRVVKGERPDWRSPPPRQQGTGGAAGCCVPKMFIFCDAPRGPLRCGSRGRPSPSRSPSTTAATPPATSPTDHPPDNLPPPPHSRILPRRPFVNTNPPPLTRVACFIGSLGSASHPILRPTRSPVP